MSNNKWSYDLETFSSIFCAVFKNVETGEILTFEISKRKNEIKELLTFLKTGVKLIGFNNINFDYPVLHWLIYNYSKHQNLEKAICSKAQDIIKEEFSAIRAKNVLIPQLDLFRIHHYDNRNKSTSLKQLETVMKMDTVEDLPYGVFDDLTTDEEFDNIIKYCIHDVEATYEFYNLSEKHINLRRNLTKEYNIDLFNHNDSKMGEEIIKHFLSKEMSISKYDLNRMRSPADVLVFKDYILDYINFSTTPLKTLLNNIKNVRTKDTRKAFSYTSNIGGFEIDYGQGGLHGCIKSGIYESYDDVVILDLDVASFYPNLAIVNNFKPKHLGEAFGKVYKSMFIERKKYHKSDPRNYALKTSLNGSYGKSNDENSFLYDPTFTMKITLNGQLLLTMLMEDIFIHVPITLLQANTDGFTLMTNKSNIIEIFNLVDKWEKLTNLEMESAYYSKMVIRDVNNYISVYENGDTKLKGCFEIDRDWHKNHSQRIVPLALKEYFINNIPIEDTIYKHKDIFDFCKVVKSKGGAKYIDRHIAPNGHISEFKLQKVNRYIVSTNGSKLIKILPPLYDEDGNNKRDKLAKYRKENPLQLDMFNFVEDVKVDKDRDSEVEAGWKTTILNNIGSKKIEDYDICYEYYIDQCNRIIKQIR